MKELVLPTLATVERYAKLFRVGLHGRSRSPRNAWAFGTFCGVRFLPGPEHEHLGATVANEFDRWVAAPIGELLALAVSLEICEADGDGTRYLGSTKTKIAEKHAKIVNVLFPNVLWMPGATARDMVRARDMGSEEFVAVVAPLVAT